MKNDSNEKSCAEANDMLIKVFLTDADGCLTDGCYYVFADLPGRAKKFHTRDFHGMMLLHQFGVEVGVLSRADSKTVERQFDNAAKYAHVFMKVQDKLQFVKERYIDSGKVQWDEIAYVGDDLPDIPLLKKVGWAACPADADHAVLAAINRRGDGLVLSNKGGQGCIREFANLILKCNGDWDKVIKE